MSACLDILMPRLTYFEKEKIALQRDLSFFLTGKYEIGNTKSENNRKHI
jgi:hypothetical protein